MYTRPIAHHIIDAYFTPSIRILHPHYLSLMAFCDVASNICQALAVGIVLGLYVHGLQPEALDGLSLIPI